MTEGTLIHPRKASSGPTGGILLVPLVASFALIFAAPKACGDLFEDFDGGGTTPWHLTNSTGSPPAVLAGGPTGNFVSLINASGNSNNSVAFDENLSVTGPAPNGKILSVDFRMSTDGTTPEVAAMGFGYAAIGPWGSTGPRNPGAEDVDNDWDQPAYAGAAMVGLDVSPDGDLVNLNAFEIQLAAVDVQPVLDLDSGLFHRAMLKVTPNPADPTTALFDLDIIEDVHGAATLHSVMSDIPANINLAGLPGNRVIAGATAGDLLFTADIDNVGVIFIPEPSSVALAVLAAVGFVPLIRRKVGRVNTS